MGDVSQYASKNAIEKALRKLRNPSRYRGMSISAMLELRQKLLDDANVKIEKLYESLELLINGVPIDQMIQAELDARKQRVCELGFSQRINNHFLCEGIYTVDDLLTLDSLGGLTARCGFGLKSRDKLLSKMREQW